MSDSAEDRRGPVPGPALEWLADRGTPARSVERLAGDLSVRSYFRLHLGSGDSLVLAIYPEGETGPCRRFLETDRILRSIEVPTPGIVTSRCDAGWMLLEDLGSTTWFESHGHLSWTESRSLYLRAMSHSRSIAALDPSTVAALNPPLDAGALRRELELSWEVALEPERLIGEGSVPDEMARALDRLCDRLEAEGLVPAHRDFMVRNLVVSGSGEIVVLDHQDLRLAPRGYDLASLFNDSLFPPPERVRELIRASSSCSEEQYRRAVVQRCLKAVGSYRRASRDGRSLHEPLVRPTLSRAWTQFEHLPELRSLREPLAVRWRSFLGEG